MVFFVLQKFLPSTSSPAAPDATGDDPAMRVFFQYSQNPGILGVGGDFKDHLTDSSTMGRLLVLLESCSSNSKESVFIFGSQCPPKAPDPQDLPNPSWASWDINTKPHSCDQDNWNKGSRKCHIQTSQGDMRKVRHTNGHGKSGSEEVGEAEASSRVSGVGVRDLNQRRTNRSGIQWIYCG